MAEQKEQAAPSYIGNSNDYKAELEALKKKYGDKYKSLYPREFAYVSAYDYKDKNKASVDIMQFNMLADGLSGIHVAENAKDEESHNKTFVDVPKECLHFGYRGFRIVEEICRNEPDIVCMEEVDQMQFLEHYLSPLHYKGIFNPKASSPCIKIGEANGIKLNGDGVAVFYNSQKYDAQFVKQYGKKMEDKTENPQGIDIPAIAVVFEHKKTKKAFIVCVAHLKSTKNFEGEQIRLNQLQHLLPSVKRLSMKHGEAPVFVCADLNTDNHKAYSLVYESIMFASSMKRDDKEKPKLPDAYTDGYDKLNLYSAYFDAAIPDTNKKEKQEPAFTTLKKRADGITKHTIDYVFYQREKAKCVRLLSIPDEKQINSKTLIPGW
eukprot:CAMPEP_0197020742 /NCGR_PEP_ID=MMETSP1384-20130603/1614_1 /TAXON_ID=29189 /ORGANISM="Ammonia sp." /LENGTH=377 /DNA_ID=CAMNT_0042448427 /DNA_START=18 /DNA_END=1148 /DNA_ORIENTATION=+